MQLDFRRSCLNEDECSITHCGCLSTSEKLKQILSKFPQAPPPTPATLPVSAVTKSSCQPYIENASCISAYCTLDNHPVPFNATLGQNFGDEQKKCDTNDELITKTNDKFWHFLADIIALIQLSTAAVSVALYYLLYMYMQLVYFVLQGALYFLNADGPMKITIGVVTVTALVVAFNIIFHLGRFIGVLY